MDAACQGTTPGISWSQCEGSYINDLGDFVKGWFMSGLLPWRWYY